MDRSLEVLRLPSNSRHSKESLDGIIAAAQGAGWRVSVTSSFKGRSSVLVVYGVGSEINNAARNAQLAKGGRVVMFDLGYFGPKKTGGYFKVSIDVDHPHKYMDLTPNDPRRWKEIGIQLREDAGDGPVVLVGMGSKAKRYLNQYDWESRKASELRARFPDREIFHRVKPGRKGVVNGRRSAANETPIDQVLKGASLVVCRHSNVGIDAAIAGVPFECEDGAAKWLVGKPYTRENRLDFLRRCAHWQWKATESREAWKFLTGIMNAT
jgi:hypothetical protein